jgi:cell division initiation protein
MNLTPNDIRNYEFQGQLRGYKKDAVDEFQEEAANALETARQENLKLSMEVESLNSQLTGLKQFEDTIKGAAIDARRNADMTVSNAKQEAELIISRANVEAEKAIESRSQKITDIEGQLNKLDLVKRSYVSKLKGMISSHLELVEEIVRSELSEEREDALDITDSSEVKTKVRETIATEPSGQKSIKTEEANAPGRIVPASPDDAPSDSSEKSADDTGPIDPELAKALENYTDSVSKVPPEHEEASSTPAEQPDHEGPSAHEGPPVSGSFTETNARAEDIPKGFVGKPDEENADSTDKTMQRTPVSEPPMDRQPMSPDDLEQSIDEVSAKFEEEMDKAEKN